MFILVIFFSFNASAESEKLDTESDKLDDFGWVLFPVAFYSSDTSLGGGLSVVLYKEVYKDKLISRSNSFTSVVFYTLKNQLLNANIGNLYWFDAKLHWKSKLLISKYPTEFYGVGNDTPESNNENFEPFYTTAENTIDYRLFEAFYLGVLLTQGYYKVRSSADSGLVQEYYSDKRESGFYNGIGLEINRDTRNNTIYPEKGHFSTVSFSLFNKYIGSQYDFVSFKFNHRSYFSIPLKSVFAWQFYMNVVAGEPPLNYLPGLGSKDLLRGYPQGRYRDNIYIATQVEWRVPLFWRIGGVLFAGAGKIQTSFSEFIFEDIKWSLGFGVRIKLTKKTPVNFRFDMGFTPEGFQFYFNLLEAF